MQVAVIRHGESQAGARLVHQNPDTPLSRRGRQQALNAAASLAGLPFQSILSSQLSRAKQTANVLGEALHLNCETLAELNEWRRPTALLGLAYSASEAQSIRKIIRAHYDDPKWHYSDEENFYEVVQRARVTLNRLASNKQDKIVVSHARFLSVLFSLIASCGSLDVGAYLANREQFYVDNGSISLLEYCDGSWSIITFNRTPW